MARDARLTSDGDSEFPCSRGEAGKGQCHGDERCGNCRGRVAQYINLSRSDCRSADGQQTDSGQQTADTFWRLAVRVWKRERVSREAQPGRYMYLTLEGGLEGIPVGFPAFVFCTRIHSLHPGPGFWSDKWRGRGVGVSGWGAEEWAGGSGSLARAGDGTGAAHCILYRRAVFCSSYRAPRKVHVPSKFRSSSEPGPNLQYAQNTLLMQSAAVRQIPLPWG